MMRMIVIYIVAALALGTLGTPSMGQTIRLKSLATVELHQDVRLGDVAGVTADDARKADELANTVLISSIEKPLQLKAEAVLMAVMAQRGAGALGNNLQVSGAAACTIEIKNAAVTPVLTLSNLPSTALQPPIASPDYPSHILAAPSRTPAPPPRRRRDDRVTFHERG